MSLTQSYIQKKSDSHLAALSGFGIFLVVLGHSVPILPGSNTPQAASENDQLYSVFLLFIQWIYSFHMPLFFFISGFSYGKFSKKKNVSFGNFLSGKFSRLIIPYIVLSSIAYPIKVFLSQYAVRPVGFSAISYLANLVYPWQNVIFFYWFLPTLFMTFTLVPLFNLSLRKNLWIFLLLIVLFIFYLSFPHKNEYSPLNIYGALHNSIFFFFGLLFYEKDLLTKVNVASITALSALFVGSVGLWASSFYYSINAVSIVTALSGILFSYFLVEKIYKRIPALSQLGNYSYQIYLFSWFSQVFVRVLFAQLLDVNIWLIVALGLVFGLFVPVLVVVVLDHMFPQKLRFLYGR